MPNLLRKALAFHSYTPTLDPNLGTEGLVIESKTKASDYLIFENKWNILKFLIFLSIITLSILTLIGSLDPFAKDTVFWGILGYILTASFALIGIQARFKVASDRNALEAIQSIWQEETIYQNALNVKEFWSVDGVKSTWKLGVEKNNIASFQAYANKIKKLMHREDIDEPKKGELYALLSINIAFNEEDEFKAVLPIIKENGEGYSIISATKAFKLTGMLNNAEQLCQGVYFNLYDEVMVKDYLASSLSTIARYLLPFIYAKRELHAWRLYRSNLIMSNLDFPENGYKFDSKTTDDFLWEYLEYYCYRWDWYSSYNGYTRPVQFKYFHMRIKKVYDEIFESLIDSDGIVKNLPFCMLASNHNIDEYLK